MIQRCLSANGLRTWRQLKSVRTLQKIQYRQLSQVGSSQEQPERKWEEVRIPVPWGHIAGKWWGPQTKQPVLAMHGWLDNAGTFDPLMKLLPPTFSLLSLDLPGHGKSSHYPKGIPHHSTEDIICIRRVVKHFGWKKISFLSHSMGSTYSFLYASIFPNEVEKLVGIDILRPFAFDPEKYVQIGGLHIDKFIETVLSTKEPPETSVEDLVQRQHEGSEKSVTLESSRLLLERGAYQSEKNPGLVGLRRDVRLKVTFLHSLPHEHLNELASRIRCEVYNIKAKGGMYYEKRSYYRQTIDIIKQNAKKMEYYEVEGTHHTHLNTPEHIVDLIKNIYCDQF
ncbi:probable serine hydrolase isoform X1 [Neocloeon triangulifer]|uniref:probable serine hydrolase isoform X1 n=1 Tax=Neocloeon triangulifer TaxID=2078957 RepID=UPI00286F9E8A|nr:probable serine hydrolase isoform X1 [Neocloeon triangulifer]XP_059484874.1 probable serine hydrolase isoform X1 [Neocloeon triangulifer]